MEKLILPIFSINFNIILLLNFDCNVKKIDTIIKNTVETNNMFLK